MVKKIYARRSAGYKQRRDENSIRCSGGLKIKTIPLTDEEIRSLTKALKDYNPTIDSEFSMSGSTSTRNMKIWIG